MKKTSVLALATVFLLASVCFAGERNMIRNFDKNGLKDLNNQLKKQEKLIKKLQKQLGQSGISTTTVQSTEDFVSETVLDSAGTVINTVPAVGVAREDGRLELYNDSIDEPTVISIEPSSYVHETQAKIAVPSSYFLDLRGVWVSDTEQKYTADLLVLHDNNGNTLTLTNIDETNNIGTAGPIAGGRDRVGGFNNNSWIYFFIIYNPVTGDISSLSSQASATAPTLPTGYTFFVRVGAVPTDVWAHLTKTVQIKDRVFHGVIWCAWDSHATGLQDLSALIAYYIPPTGKIIHGIMGLSAGTTPRKARVTSDSTPVISIGALCDAQGTADEDYGVSGSKTFDLPLTSPQTMYWQTETTDNIYALGITGYTDDL